MSRFRSAIVGGFVALSVFTYLALPILKDMFGQKALLPVYGGLGIVAGVVVYLVLTKAQRIASNRGD